MSLPKTRNKKDSSQFFFYLACFTYFHHLLAVASNNKCRHVEMEDKGMSKSRTSGRRHNTNQGKKVEKFMAYSGCANEGESQRSGSGTFSLVEGRVEMVPVLKSMGSINGFAEGSEATAPS